MFFFLFLRICNNVQDAEILYARKTMAHVGWPRRLVGVTLGTHHHPPIMHNNRLAEIVEAKGIRGSLR